MYPYLFQLGHLSLPTYGALAALGLMLALWLSQRTAPLAGVSPERLWNAGLFAVIAAFVISRVLLLAEHFATFRHFPLLLLAVPALTPPGLLITVVLTLLGLWWRGVSVPRALDAWAPCVLLVWAFLALGHFAEGSDPGMASSFGLRLPHDRTATHPVALYACLLAALLALLTYRRLARDTVRSRAPGQTPGQTPGQVPGRTAGLAFAAAGVVQFLLSFLRQPAADAGLGLDPLQWVALGLLVGGTLLAVSGPPRTREV